MKRLIIGAALLFAVIGLLVGSAPAQACGLPRCLGCRDGFVLASGVLGKSVAPIYGSYVAEQSGTVYAAGKWKLQIKRGDSVITMVGHPRHPKVGLFRGGIFAGDQVTGWVYDPVSVLIVGGDNFC
jgi:hypothetical protein